ncbi:MAG: NUDIX hydrolase [Alphaproteobacteria bacterium]|nr:NUDIX hydrolase [Alphaproteobacteria bacterium]MBU2084971.1 NUDIX hydrolase [Alphaproteobacteria bacterium]MBU2143951.1 NUDIX hydrolase [Alphaproteobacteria bacterium]MBU2198066.1 NUDIX hydrolase [Alphaproteobacteria bacterium]
MTDDLANGSITPDFISGVPDGDERERRICNTCGFIDYVNPKIVAGSVVTDRGGRVLLCRRAIEPRKGFWTLPAGFMEENETVEHAAQREAKEEACADIRIEQMLAVYSVPRISQVQIMFRAKLESSIDSGPESLEVGLFDWKDIPWSELAFPTVVWALTHYASTRHLNAFPPFTNPPGTEKITR